MKVIYKDGRVSEFTTLTNMKESFPELVDYQDRRIRKAFHEGIVVDGLTDLLETTVEKFVWKDIEYSPSTIKKGLIIEYEDGSMKFYETVKSMNTKEVIGLTEKIFQAQFRKKWMITSNLYKYMDERGIEKIYWNGDLFDSRYNPPAVLF